MSSVSRPLLGFKTNLPPAHDLNGNDARGLTSYIIRLLNNVRFLLWTNEMFQIAYREDTFDIQNDKQMAKFPAKLYIYIYIAETTWLSRYNKMEQVGLTFTLSTINVNCCVSERCEWKKNFAFRVSLVFCVSILFFFFFHRREFQTNFKQKVQRGRERERMWNDPICFNNSRFVRKFQTVEMYRKSNKRQ